MSSLDTIVTVDGHDKAGIAYFMIDPEIKNNNVVDAVITNQGYVSIDMKGTGSVHVAAKGLGSQDGFSEYFLGGGRSRWGDYGSASGFIRLANRFSVNFTNKKLQKKKI